MSKSKNTWLYNEITDEYSKESNKLLNKIITQQQKKHQIKNYPDAESDTSMTCIVCGGSYTPRNRFLHNRTKKHLKSIDSIKNYVYS